MRNLSRGRGRHGAIGERWFGQGWQLRGFCRRRRCYSRSVILPCFTRHATTATMKWIEATELVSARRLLVVVVCLSHTELREIFFFFSFIFGEIRATLRWTPIFKSLKSLLYFSSNITVKTRLLVYFLSCQSRSH